MTILFPISIVVGIVVLLSAGWWDVRGRYVLTARRERRRRTAARTQRERITEYAEREQERGVPAATIQQRVAALSRERGALRSDTPEHTREVAHG